MQGRQSKKKPSDVLLPIHSPPKRPRIVTFDVESKDGVSDRKGFSRAFLVGLWDGQDYQAFRNFDHVRSLSRAIEPGGCVDLFMREILGRRDRKDPTKIHGGRPELASPTSTLFSHNGGRFDTTFMLTWLRRHSSEFEFSVVSVASAAQLIAVRRRRASPRSKEKRPTWRFVDSAKILPMSLKQAAELFCAGNAEVQKQADFDLDTPEDDPAWEHYNKLDCIALEAALGSFRDLVEGLGGELGVTAPSTSMRLFRRAFLDERGFQRHRHFPSCVASPFVCESSEKKRGLDGHDACLHDWIRRGYHGGRCEIFRMVAPPGVRYYDLNSSYPASMLEPMPVGDCREVGPDEWPHVHKRLAQTHVGFVECTVHVPPSCYVPPLPYHDTKLDKLVFPTGTFSGVFSWAELELLPEVGGAIVGPIVRSVWFEARPVFRPFVESLYRFRNKKDKAYSQALSELAKLMLNSHYGKYGMKPDREELVIIEGGVDRFPDNGKPLCGDHLNADCWVVPKVIDAPYMIPQVAAHITSLSRIRVWRALQTAHAMGGHVFYSDTDSILVDRPPGSWPDWWADFEAAIGVGDKLGEWKREHPGWVLSAQFVLPKSYMLKNEAGSETVVKLKGISRSARTPENFARVVAGETVEFQRVTQHRTVLKSGAAGPLEVTAKKRITSTYDKRQVLANGNTAPLVLGGVRAPRALRVGAGRVDSCGCRSTTCRSAASPASDAWSGSTARASCNGG